ncbi:MAG: hypothetical protein Kow00124_19250 [Anaerolineae bacterium]
MAIIENGWGLDLILWFQSWRTPLVQAFFLPFHYLGSETFYLLVIPLIYWCIDAAFGRRVSVVFLLSAWSNGWLKHVWGRPRPFEVSPAVRNVVVETSRGIPSGHAQHTTALFGTIAARLRKGWVTAIIVLYVLLMGLSRMVLGVHFPQDVMGGWLFGLLLVIGYMVAERPLTAWLSTRSLNAQLALALGAGVLALVIFPGLYPGAPPTDTEGAVSAAATLLGALLGMPLELRYVGFDAGGPLWKRAARLALGLAVAFALRFGLGALFAELEPAVMFRVIRYGLIGLWMVLLAPWTFVRIGLADQRAE